jgi:predicted amidohydrolase YtcJ
VDLAGQTLIPGFVDAHAHIWKIGHLLTTLLDVRGASQPRRRGGAAARARRTIPTGNLAAGTRLQRGPLRRRPPTHA